MDRIIQSPGKYIQGAGVMGRLGQYAKPLAQNYLIIIDKFVQPLVEFTINQSFLSEKVAFTIAPFNGECSETEIQRLINMAETATVTGIIGIGGGKTLDTAKAVAYHKQLPVIVAPTIASTDAPCSALSVIYTDEGEFESYLLLPANPNIVLVDSQLIVQAPARLLAAGIGDALATYFEARASQRHSAKTMAGGQCTQAAASLAFLCYKTLIEEGHKAILATNQKVCTEAVERVIEANTYLSGVGFESGGLAAAHAIHNGLTVIGDTHHLYHGEKVAFGTLAQLMLENADTDEIDTVCELCRQVGLPITLEAIGITEDIPAKIRKVAEASCAEGETIHAMPFPITAEKVYAAIIAADAYGTDFLRQI